MELHSQQETESPRKSRLLDILFISSMFLFTIVFIKQPAEIYASYIPMVLLLPLFFLKYGLPKIAVTIFIPLLVSGIIYIGLGDNTLPLFLKIFLGFFMSVSFYYFIFKEYDLDVVRLFELYSKAAYLIALIGIIQIVAYQLGISPLYNFKWILNKWGFSEGGLGIRLNSILSEPAYIAASLAPALFLSLNNLLRKEPLIISKRKSVIIIAAYILSFSSLAVIAIFLSLIFILRKMGLGSTILLTAPVVIGSFLLAYYNIDEFRERLDSTLVVFSGEEFDSYSVHGSSFVLYDNYKVASENFAENPLFGTGLGSHAKAYEKLSITNNFGIIDITLNSSDANSLFLRLLSETGLYGVIFFLVFIVRNFVSYRSAPDEIFWVISMGCFIIIILHLIRQGHFFYNGFPFFLWLYYFTKMKTKEINLELNEDSDSI